MHVVIFNIVLLDWLEGSKTYMQGDIQYFNTLFFYFIQQFFCKMQTGCWTGS